MLDETPLRNSDVIVLFEMLGAFLHPPAVSIADPYQRSVAETEQIAAPVEAALPGLAQILGLPSRLVSDASPAPIR